MVMLIALVLGCGWAGTGGPTCCSGRFWTRARFSRPSSTWSRYSRCSERPVHRDHRCRRLRRPDATKLVADGIRGVAPTTVEAAQSAGSTRWQIITKVQLPMARRLIVLATNQGLLYVLAMVVIGGLVEPAPRLLVVAGFRRPAVRQGARSGDRHRRARRSCSTASRDTPPLGTAGLDTTLRGPSRSKERKNGWHEESHSSLARLP